MWISGVSDDFREEWGENGSQVSDLENHQDGGGGTRKERSLVLDCGVCRYRIWAGGGGAPRTYLYMWFWNSRGVGWKFRLGMPAC